MWFILWFQVQYSVSSISISTNELMCFRIAVNGHVHNPITKLHKFALWPANPVVFYIQGLTNIILSINLAHRLVASIGVFTCHIWTFWSQTEIGFIERNTFNKKVEHLLQSIFSLFLGILVTSTDMQPTKQMSSLSTTVESYSFSNATTPILSFSTVMLWTVMAALML